MSYCLVFFLSFVYKFITICIFHMFIHLFIYIHAKAIIKHYICNKTSSEKTSFILEPLKLEQHCPLHALTDACYSMPSSIYNFRSRHCESHSKQKPPIHATVFAMLWWTAQTSAKICKPTNATAFATVFTHSCEFKCLVRMSRQWKKFNKDTLLSNLNLASGLLKPDKIHPQSLLFLLWYSHKPCQILSTVDIAMLWCSPAKLNAPYTLRFLLGWLNHNVTVEKNSIRQAIVYSGNFNFRVCSSVCRFLFCSLQWSLTTMVNLWNGRAIKHTIV